MSTPFTLPETFNLLFPFTDTSSSFRIPSAPAHEQVTAQRSIETVQIAKRRRQVRSLAEKATSEILDATQFWLLQEYLSAPDPLHRRSRIRKVLSVEARSTPSERRRDRAPASICPRHRSRSRSHRKPLNYRTHLCAAYLCSPLFTSRDEAEKFPRPVAVSTAFCPEASQQQPIYLPTPATAKTQSQQNTRASQPVTVDRAARTTGKGIQPHLVATEKKQRGPALAKRLYCEAPLLEPVGRA
ncbi:hypothetical protein K432DRAFT_391741 [Lepidopterella palustris CBS 459.81]|uniref:Uncharacterized protein n=1 Tax=Lepidopterella palustris CBS 459.81 TaxID=1314670 RepID=A0A8E2EDN7_9PEZI|nr:hypothetical protein K432DRAFT_391741 [Lepidopterella palustris CBS 459.81]